MSFGDACRAGWLQLASATLPVGAFSHSLGMEAAQAAAQLQDANQAECWIGDYLRWIWAPSDAIYWLQLYQAWQAQQSESIQQLNQQVAATRDTAELRLENEQTGRSLRQWLLTLPELPGLDRWQQQQLTELQPPSWLSVHACAASCLNLSPADGLYALAWSLLESLVAAAVRLVPLGQSAGQAILRRQALQLEPIIAKAIQLTTDGHPACNFAPMLSLLSSDHETQYSRLFRS